MRSFSVSTTALIHSQASALAESERISRERRSRARERSPARAAAMASVSELWLEVLNSFPFTLWGL